MERKDMPQGFVTRAIPPRVSTLREDDRSVEFVISTETPARVADWDRGEIVEEVLLQSGMVLPGNKQVPFLDAHGRFSTEDVLGSMREFRNNGDETIARAFFSRKQKAFDAYQDVRDGHLTDCSVGYVVTESAWVPEGQKMTISGREYVGPVKVSTRWELREVSLVPIGADPYAKARSENASSGAIRAENKQEEPNMESNTPVTPVTPPAAPAVDLEAVRAKAIETERERVASITALCSRHNCADLADGMIRGGATIEAAKDQILKQIEERQAKTPTPKVELVADAKEKFRAAAVDGLVLKSTSLKTAAPGSEEFRGFKLLRIAERCLNEMGINTKSMNEFDIAGLALGLNRRGAYPIANGIADFTNILYDASNKILQQAYMEADRTWDIWCKIASAPDFKTIYRPMLSESGNLALINENGEYTETKFSDRVESYAISTYGRRFTVSRKAIINDDQGALSSVPRMFGDAAQRLIETMVYSILTANGNMSDGKALFVSDHANLVSGEAFGTDGAAIQRMMTAMRTQTGFGENAAILGIMPKFVIVPAALEFKASVAVASSANPASSSNSGVVNPLANKGLVVVPAPLLDATSATAAYMAAGAGAETVEVAFLNGNRAPMLEEVDQTDVDGRIYKVRIDVGAKALDWRGLVKHSGS